MEKRTVLQWDKDACEFMGLVKFDLLGLGMLSALDHMMRIVAEHLGEHWELSTIPKEEPAVYDMLCRADSVGVFQVESRAQIGTLPRLRPREFYDLAIEIALIRPGPIQGGAVHPYVRRATGREAVEYAHPLLIPVLERTHGVPLFQEQLMDMARVLGDCNRDEADLLRRAMGSKRGIERIESIKEKLMAGMARKGIAGDRGRRDLPADPVLRELRLRREPRAVLRQARLRQLVVQAALPGRVPRRAAARPADGVLLARSRWSTTPAGTASRCSAPTSRCPGRPPTSSSPAHPVRPGSTSCLVDGARAEWVPARPTRPRSTGGTRAYAVRLGLDSVRGIGTSVAERIVAARAERPFADQVDLSRRAGLDARQLEALATAGVFDGTGLNRRQALWNAGWTETDEHLEGIRVAGPAPMLPEMDDVEITMADMWATGITPERAPVRAPAGPAARGRDQGGRRHRDRRVRAPGARRGAGHPPAAAGHRRWRHVPQPRGRDRDAQRDLHGRGVAALPERRQQLRRAW